ncbi:ATP-binding protein [Dyella tabacisoli]|uniref:Sensory/regulatory protein RpfC n=1 Tax=Dyella tabacisoli TaxID=2282381 RepID=A0A369UGR1_9GAMM|nr:transporter substrate-binding domain-containing protein [Dyella tabacisoli]RDD79736.1 response regulator [Dyella tabacisoli]
MLWLWLLLLLPLTSLAAPRLSTEERAWLATHPTLRVGTYRDGLPPLESLDNGKLAGLGPAYLQQVLDRLGLQSTLQIYPDRQSLWSAAVRGEVDVMLNVMPGLSDDTHMLYSTPYLEVSTVIVTRRDDTRIRSGDDLPHKHVAAVSGSPASLAVRQQIPDATVVTAPDLAGALDMLSHGQADALVSDPYSIRDYLGRNKNDTIRVVGPASLSLSSLTFGIPLDHQLLASAVNKALADIPNDVQTQIRAQWLQPYPALAQLNTGLVLSSKEREWLAQLPPLRVTAGENYPPFSFLDALGRPIGLDEDYFNYVVEQLGLRVERVRRPSLTAILQSAKAGEVDLIATVTPSAERADYLLFSHAYVRFPVVIVTRQSAENVSDLRSLARAKVAAPMVSASIPGIVREIPKAIVLDVPTTAEGLRMVASGQADAYIDNLAAVDKQINDRYAGLLKVAAPTGYDEELAIGVSPRYAPLVPLINRALINMPAEKQELIRNTWIPVHYSYGVSWRTVAKHLAPFVLVVLIAVTVLLLAYLRLRREIARRQRVEQRLDDQLSFQRTLMETVPYPLLAKDSSQRYIAVNLAYETMMGVPRERLLGRTTTQADLYDDALTERFEAMSHEAAEHGQSFHLDLQYRDGAGREREGLYWLKPFQLANGSPGGVVVTLVDVTDIRTAERRARASEERLLDVTQSLPVAVFQVCLHPDGNMEFPFIAGDTEGIFGLSRASITEAEAHLRALLHEDDRPLLGEAVQQMSETLQPFRLELRIRVNNQLRWILASSGSGRRLDNGDIVWGGYWEDITHAREQAQALAQAKEAAEVAAQAKADFLATMSHEIRTPMGGVLGMLELIEQTPLSTEQRHMLGTVETSAEVLLQVIDDILDFSKIEAGRLSIEHASMDLRMQADKVLGIVAQQAHQKNLRLRVRVDAALAANLLGDALRLRQIMLNLLNNAIKFTERGSINVRIEVLHDEPDTQRVRLTVADTGIGISPEQQKRLFQPFQQAESSTTRRFGGSGLGLAICRRLAEMMGGTLTLHSKPGAGTQISLVVSLGVEQRHNPDPQLSGRHALIASHHGDDAQTLADYLTALGMLVRQVQPQPDSSIAALIGHDDVDLLFADEAVLANDDRHDADTSCACVALTTTPHRPGHYLAAGIPMLSTNPLSWDALALASRDALGLLPAQQVSHAQAPSVAAPPSREQAQHAHQLILVAEDHPAGRDLLQRQLHQLGYACDLVNDGVEAADALTRTDYALLITDCHMPRLDGYGLSRRIRDNERNGTRHLPVVALTAGALPEQKQVCMDAGMDDYLSKPVRLAALHGMLQKWLPPAKANDPIDLELLREAYGSGDEVTRMIHMLIKTSRDETDQVEAMLADNNRIGLADGIHHIRGAVAMLKADAVTAAALKLELSLQEAHGDIDRDGIAAFIVQIREFVRALERMVG